MVAAKCNIKQRVPITSNPKTDSQADSALDGPIRLSILSGDGSAELDPNNPLRFFVVSGAAPGVTVVLVEADGDLGEGVVLLQETIELTVTGENASSFGFTVEAAEPKP